MPPRLKAACLTGTDPDNVNPQTPVTGQNRAAARVTLQEEISARLDH